MFRKFTETEKWYLLSEKPHIMQFKKFEIEKPEDLYITNQMKLNEVSNKRKS